MKVRVQAQHLQPGDIVGSGEKVVHVVRNSTQFPSRQVQVKLVKYAGSDHEIVRTVLWGKHTMINAERPEQ